jgi:DNA polymerase-3 subunit gamma/tau
VKARESTKKEAPAVAEKNASELEPEVNQAPREKPTAQTQMATDETTTGEGGDGVATQDILAAWSRIRAEVKARRPQAEGLLNSQRLVQVKNGTLVLGFQSETLKSKMEIPENIEVTRRVVQNLLNADLPIQCIVVVGKGAAGADDTAIEPDGLVNTAINLGGKLIHRD